MLQRLRLTGIDWLTWLKETRGYLFFKRVCREWMIARHKADSEITALRRVDFPSIRTRDEDSRP